MNKYFTKNAIDFVLDKQGEKKLYYYLLLFIVQGLLCS